MAAFILDLLMRVIRMIFTTPSATVSQSSGTTMVDAPSIPTLLDRARRTGIVLAVVLSVAGCGSTAVHIATLTPIDDTTKGWPRVAQNSVRVMIDQTGTIGTVEPAAGYFLVHESDLKAILKQARTTTRPQ